MVIQSIGKQVDVPGSGSAPAGVAVSGAPPGEAPPVPQPHANAELRRALDALAQHLDSRRTQLSFRVDQQLNQVVISIVDPDSGAVLRQIPGEEVLRMAQNLQEYLGGLVDEKV